MRLLGSKNLFITCSWFAAATALEQEEEDRMATAFDEATTRYIQWVTRIPQLTLKEELALARKAQKGDNEARDRLIESNLRHVVPQALKYRHYGVPVGELIAQGNAALLTAVDRFEPERGLRFSTYAVYWIRADMLQHMLRQRHMVGGGRGALRPKFFFQLRKQYEALLLRTGDADQAAREVGERFKRTPEAIRDIVAKLDSRDASLDAKLSRDADSGTMLDLIRADGQAHDEVFEQRQRNEELQVVVGDILEGCTERDRYIVEHRLMVDDKERESLVAIGKRFGVSRERVRQLEQRLKERLRSRLEDVAQRWEFAAA